jgi:membrane protein DedA with SNARE-associated domain
MTLESFVTTYGYLAILTGTFLEGETILILGGFAAYRGYLELPWVILVAFIGTLSGDQLFFYLGRKHSQTILARRPSWKVRVDKAIRLLKRFQIQLILVFRFFYGLRTVVPFVIGASSFPAKRFILLNVVGALIWATVVGVGGYLFGHALKIIIGDIKRYELETLGAIAGTGLMIWFLHLVRAKIKQKSS